MQRWLKGSKWLMIAGLAMLIVVGVVAWMADPGATTHVVTPTLPATSPPTEPSETPTPTATPTEIPPTWTPTPSATPTLKPSPTATLTPSPTATPTLAAIPLPSGGTLPEIAGTPVISSPLPQPSPMPYVEQPAGTVNILLLGMDREWGESAARTDVMVIASIFPDVPAVSLLSIPRDYYAWIPAWGLDKINTAYLRAERAGYPGGGPALVKDTVEYNFGVPIHYYAMVDFRSYRTLVDAVGGVDIIVECPFHDTYPDPEVPEGQSDIDLMPGLHHLGGKHALWYVRSRWNTSDFDRHRRQQQVLLAILRQARSANMLVRIPELWGMYQQDVETDLGLKELITLGSVALRLDERDIHNYFIRGSHMLTGWTAPNGGAVLVPNLEVVHTYVQDTMRPLSTSRATQRAYRVNVSNGSWGTALGDVAAYRLGLEGFEVVGVERVDPVVRTQVIDYTTTSKGSPLWKLVGMYRLQDYDVIAQPTEDSPVDFEIILGSNYNPCTATSTAYWQPTPTPTATPDPAEVAGEAPEGEVPTAEAPAGEAPAP